MLDNVSHPHLQPFYDRMAQASTMPLWELYKGLIQTQPVTFGVPHLWRYREIRALLMDAGTQISQQEAERRVLVLQNPGLDQTGVARTLFSGLQLVLPGEVASAHRHSQSALRFVLESDNGYTTVEGERCLMRRGDFITTPSWTWHDHKNTGQEPMIWIDGLDIPMLNFYGAKFDEQHEQEQQNIERPDNDSASRWGSGLRPYQGEHQKPYSPVYNYTYERARDALEQIQKQADPDPHHGWKMIYTNPRDGGHVMPTMSAFLQKLPAHFTTQPWRSTESCVFVVSEGKGTAYIGDTVVGFSENDVFVAPNWMPIKFETTEEAVLFSFSDRAAQENLGLWREDPMT